MINELKAALAVMVSLVAPSSRLFVPAQSSSSPTPTKARQSDNYQRSVEIYTYATSAKSGPVRGEELYYYKCWFCHNQYAKTGPQLRELYKRGTFESTGEEVNDGSVAAKINQGGPGMPAFRTSLKDADVSDLLSYIKSGNCCFNSQDPPPNPRYRGGKQ